MPHHPDEEFCARHRKALMNSVRYHYRVFKAEDVEDVVQTAFLGYFRRRSRVGGDNSIALLYTILLRAAANHYRRSYKPGVGAVSLEDMDLPAPDPDADLRRDAQRCFELVQKHRPQDLEHLVLRFEGCPENLIAEMLGITSEACRQRWSRLTAFIRGHIRRGPGDAPGGDSRPEKEER